MVNTRGKQRTGSNRTPDANMEEPIALSLSEGQTSHSLTVNMEKPDADGQYEGIVEIPVEKAENEGFQKMPVEEKSERATKVDNNDESVTEINNDNKADSKQNTSEDDETDQEDLEWDEEEELSEDNVGSSADEAEASEEEAEKDDDNGETSMEEASGEDDDGDEVSRQKKAEVAKGDESNAKAKEDEKEAKAKEVGMESKDHSSEKMEAGLKNYKNSNERNRKNVRVGSSQKVDTKDDDGDEVGRQKTAEVAKGDESNAKAKEGEKEAKAKEVETESKDHSSEKMEAGVKNDKNSNERNRKKVRVGSSKKVDTKDDDGDEVGRQKTAEVAKGDESNAKAKEDEKEAKAKEVGMESKDHSSEKMEAGLTNDKNSNERNRKKVRVGSSKKVDTKDQPESSRMRKGKKRVESMGMIFMCSSKTKNDCYQYRVLGLPESKKDIVEKIYTGMRLFLYDVDLKLMYGIYKAVGPGGYNIEPKAFKSQFPAQVRFAVLDDCLPIPEEKFKKVIKENYFTNTKFDCQLKAEQVKKLCKLFIASSKGSRSKKLRRPHKAENSRLPVHPERLRKRRVGGDERRLAPVEEHRYAEHPRKRPRKAVISHPHHQPVPVILPSTVLPYVCKMPSDVDAYNRQDQYPYRERRDPPIVNRHDPYADGYPERDYPYRDGRDPYIKSHDSYKDGRDIYLRGRDPSYVDGRASFLERREAYRGGRDLDAGIRSSYGDGRDSYLEHRDPYTYSDAYSSYRRDPVSSGLDAYREGRGGEYRGSFRRVEELCHPYVFEAGNRHDNFSRDLYVSNLQRASYAGPSYSAEYPSRAGSAPEYHL